MSVYCGPEIQNSNLILHVDAANLKSNRGYRSLINWDTWSSGTTGGATNYTQNGDGNSRVTDANPFGNSDVMWDSSNNDATSDADGGWNSASVVVDPSKMYRFSTWVRRKVIGNGSFYLGLYGNNSSNSNIGVYHRTDGTTLNTNFYFRSSGWWGNANQWYLVVGHVWPVGSGAGAIYKDSGIYDTSGNKVATINDCIWNSGTARAAHRSYLYYSTDTTTNQQWYQPRIDLIDGTEPSIAELLADSGNTWKDLTNGIVPKVVGKAPPYSTDGGGCFDFSANAGLNSSTAVSGFYFSPQPIPNTGSFTFNCWVKNVPTTVGQQLLFSNTGDANGYRFGIGTNGVYWLIGPTYTENTLAFSSFTNTQWNNVCTVFDRAAATPTVYLYLNGTLVTSQTMPASQSAWTTSGYTTAYMAKWNGQTFASYSGKLAMFQAYSKALSSAEILQNFQANRARFGI